MRGSGVREHLVAGNLRGTSSQVLVQDHAAKTVREPSTVHELLAAGVVRANTDESSIKEVAMNKAMVNSHGLSSA